MVRAVVDEESPYHVGEREASACCEVAGRIGNTVASEYLEDQLARMCRHVNWEPLQDLLARNAKEHA